MKHVVSAMLCTVLCALTVVSAWGITPAATGDESNIPLMIGLAAAAVIAIVVVLVMMKKRR